MGFWWKTSPQTPSEERREVEKGKERQEEVVQGKEMKEERRTSSRSHVI